MFEPSRKNLRFDIVNTCGAIRIQCNVMYNDMPYRACATLTHQQVWELAQYNIDSAGMLIHSLIKELIRRSKMSGRDQYILLHHPASRKIIDEFLDVLSEKISRYKK